jgi:hypothetical protein
MSIKTTVVIGLLAVLCSAEAPAVWADLFQEDFTEKMTYPIVGSGETKGTISYDWKNKRYVITRENGKWDRYCGTVFPFRSTPCTHIVSEGQRYLYFPEKSYCCTCCTAAQGCGVLKPDWTEGAVFVREYTDDKGAVIEVYNKKGLQDNLIHIQKDIKRIVRIEQASNDDQTFLTETYKEKVDASVFDVPAVCHHAESCGRLTVCGFIPKVDEPKSLDY